MALLETLARIRSQQAGGGSRAVLVRVIQPLLTELGWDVGDPLQVDLDHEGVDVVLSIPRGEQTSLADRRPGRPGVYVRFAPSEREFSAQAAGLVAEAARDGADLCALTTGQVWQLYAAKPMQEADACRFAQLDLRGDPAERVADELELYLSREALIDQRAQRSAEHALTARLDAERVAAAIPNVWRRLLAGPDSLLVEYVQDEVRKETGLHAGAEQVIAVIRSEAHIPPPVTPPDRSPIVAKPPRRRANSIGAAAMEYLASRAPASVHINEILAHLESHDRAPSGQSPRASLNTALYRFAKDGGIEAVGGGFWRTTGGRADAKRATTQEQRRQPSRRLTGYRLWGVDHQTTTWKDMLGGVAADVYQKHPDEFHRALSLHGRSRQYVATTADGMTQPVAIPNSPYVIETHFGGPQATQMARQLLALFDHDADELEILYE